MGTKADFYVGRGAKAKWMGSISYDGDRSRIPRSILRATSIKYYRSAVYRFFKKLASENPNIVTWSQEGWPWPWENSSTTDCSYWFFKGQTWEAYKIYSESEFDYAIYIPCRLPIYEVEYPNMTEGQNVNGLMVLGSI